MFSRSDSVSDSLGKLTPWLKGRQLPGALPGPWATTGVWAPAERMWGAQESGFLLPELHLRPRPGLRIASKQLHPGTWRATALTCGSCVLTCEMGGAQPCGFAQDLGSSALHPSCRRTRKLFMRLLTYCISSVSQGLSGIGREITEAQPEQEGKDASMSGGLVGRLHFWAPLSV